MTLAVLLAQAGQDVRVHLVDNHSGFDWTTLITPAGTLLGALAGGVGGVVIGGRINRNTLTQLESERRERDDALDAARAGREQALEDRRHRHALDAERRQALGAIRLVMAMLRLMQTDFELEAENEGEWLSETGETAAWVRQEDLHAMAIWVPMPMWQMVNFLLERIALTKSDRRQIREKDRTDEDWAGEAADYRSSAERLVELIRLTLEELSKHQDELEAAVRTAASAGATGGGGASVA